MRQIPGLLEMRRAALAKTKTKTPLLNRRTPPLLPLPDRPEGRAMLKQVKNAAPPPKPRRK
jgi:hypothetical protein